MSEWLDSLPEELRDAPYIGKAENAADALAKIQHAAKLVGTSVRIPTDDSSPEDRAAFMERVKGIDGITQLPTSDDIDGVMGLLSKLGYPVDPTGYTLPEVEDFEWDDDVAADLKKYAHNSGMTPGQFDAFTKQIAQQEKEADLISGQALTDQRRDVKTAWGDAVNEREELIRGWLVHSAAPKSTVEMLDSGKLPLDTLNWMLTVAQQFTGDVTPLSKDRQTMEPTLDPIAAKVELTRVLNDLTSMKDSDPRYRPLQQKLVSLQRLASASRAA
jgi:hypothetical protein